MCDCALLPPFPPDFLTQSRSPRSPPPPILARNGGARPALGGGGRRISTPIPRTGRVNPRITSINASPSSNSEPSKLDSLDGFVAAEPQEEQASVPSTFDFLELKREMEMEEVGGAARAEEDVLVPPDGPGNEGIVGRRQGGRRQMIRRSNILAKQVISIQSACSLGFVSQLWVDTRSWSVVLVEAKPNLLSGETEKFLLEDVCQVGDVVLVEDESVMENELKVIGLDTLVGYTVVTSGRRNVGKVRGYTFNINSGAVESIELDSFGIPILPSSLVTTYCLLVEDVLEVLSDTVIVQEGAMSRLQRLTKGILNSNVDIPGDEEEFFDYRKQRARTVRSQGNPKKFSRRFRQRMREIEDDWEVPMDY